MKHCLRKMANSSCNSYAFSGVQCKNVHKLVAMGGQCLLPLLWGDFDPEARLKTNHKNWCPCIASWNFHKIYNFVVHLPREISRHGYVPVDNKNIILRNFNGGCWHRWLSCTNLSLLLLSTDGATCCNWGTPWQWASIRLKIIFS